MKYLGIAASAGIGIGQIVKIEEHSIEYEARNVEDTQAELERYAKAVERFCEKTLQMSAQVRKRVGEKEAEILEGHNVMLEGMQDNIEDAIRDGSCAEAAVDMTCDFFISVFLSAPEELTRQRAADVKDIKTRMLKILLGIEDVDISGVEPGTVILAKELTPSMTAGIIKDNVAGIITEQGGITSHSAILARALEIPAVLSMKSAFEMLEDKQTVIVDGTNGEVIVAPTDEDIDLYTVRRREYLEAKKALGKYIGRSTQTAEGRCFELVANIGNPNDVKQVLENDAEGVGLFRTEFLFMDRDKMPDEEEQFEAYKKVAVDLKGRPVIVRTLDVGGDKQIPYFELPKEENPFMGYRAVRFCLDKASEVYRPQLRALLRASAYGNIKIMVPMVTCVDELRAVKKILSEIMDELEREDIPFNRNIEVGVMIETPAAVLIADILATEADFFSIGTNDLIGYTMAADRGNSKVSHLYSQYNPAVLRAIEHVIACAKNENVPVGMCGEAAADPSLIPLWISFGLNEFSVNPASVLRTRKIISEWTTAKANEISLAVMNAQTRDEVVEILKNAEN